ncbi:ThiF family adenylyltransferase [Larkinella humicola]|uniref:ThiF family adenylyltransferase n=1 Tax=Larkinella humicola TaxID=2607654 RepID=A0A5N1JG63_9BACT|nr:ThiF family adenylyltransferase [Larkinella humicola]KAA9349729.1 ThiF family adenylyltransferase [Larkinella humicola]
MQQPLINRSPDLKRLRDEGYEIELKGPYLLVHHIPYLNTSRELCFGILVTSLDTSGQTTTRPSYHVIHFTGEYPHRSDGRRITGIEHQNCTQELYPGVIVQFAFSNKPPEGYADYYHKVTRYAEIISAPAKTLYPDTTEKTFKVVPMEDDAAPFQYLDTNSGRANIYQLNARLEGQKIAIVGLGGTGAYILDLVAKTPVWEIHQFDGDVLHTHNAFRSPGAASLEELDSEPLKVEYYRNKYSNMHKGIVAHPYYVTAANLSLLDMMNFVFISLDRNEARGLIASYLRSRGIAFIDVGLGVNLVGDRLTGMIRITTSTETQNAHLHKRLPVGEQGNNDYDANIQIAELNALNANLAVIKWKKLNNFYHDLEGEHNSLYAINNSELYNEDQVLTAQLR